MLFTFHEGHYKEKLAPKNKYLKRNCVKLTVESI